MSRLFHRRSTVQCFFCQSPVLPHNLQSFRCPTCHCWNRYDEHGEIISEEPAMHIESLNLDSFAKRASPSRDQFPSVRGANLFCHTCQSNHLLLMNLLSNYLPSPSDPEYVTRLSALPEYKRSLYARYPPVCESCLPVVEDEIRRKDHMARTKALGGWLNDSKKKEQQRRVSEGTRERRRLTIEFVGWILRGVLWAATLAVSIACDLAGALGVESIHILSPVQPVLPAIVFLSLFWTFWDPTYLSFQRALRQGSHVRVRGKRTYIQIQMLAWLLRITTSVIIALASYKPGWTHRILLLGRSRIYYASCLLLECTIFAASFIVLRIHQPPAIRLLNTDAHKSTSPSTTPQPTTRSNTPTIGLGRPSALSEPDLLAALSLSSKPVTSHNPIFGLPSLPLAGPSASSATDREPDVDAMDWAPTDNSGQIRAKVRETDDASWLRPQRFFAPEKPTGLEGLFERTLLVGDDTPRVNGGSKSWNLILEGWTRHCCRWITYLLFIVPVVIGGVVYRLHDARRSADNGPHAS